MRPEINTDVKPGSDNPIVRDALELISENFSEKNKRDRQNEVLKDLAESGAEIHSVDGARKLSPKKLLQAMWRLMADLKPLDFQYHGVQRPEWEESIVTQGMGTVLRKGNYHRTFRDKGGAVQNIVAYGDAFRLINARGEKGFPMEFVNVQNSNVYFDVKATGWRTGSRPVRRVAFVFSGTWDEAVSLFPEAKKKAGIGKIPRDLSLDTETNETNLQNIKEYNEVEWCYYFDLDNRAYSLFMGSACTVLEEKKGKDFVWVLKDEEGREIPYVPASHYLCYPSLEGFYNHGVFSLIYDLVVLYTQTLNQMSGYVGEVVWPHEFITMSAKESAKFFQKIQAADEIRASGKRAYIPLETDVNGNAPSIASRSLIRQGLLNEAEALFNRIDLEIKRMGIHLDEIESADATATQVLSDDERQKKFLRFIMENNATEVENELLIVQDLTKKMVKKSDKTPLWLTTKVKVEASDGTMQEVKVDDATLGFLSGVLREHEYFAVVNSRNGVVPSNTVRRAKLMNSLQFATPGTPRFERIARQLSVLDDVDVGEDDGQPQLPQEINQPPQEGDLNQDIVNSLTQTV